MTTNDKWELFRDRFVEINQFEPSILERFHEAYFKWFCRGLSVGAPYIKVAAEQGLHLATLCDMVLGEDAPDRSDDALIRAVRELLNKSEGMK